LFASFIERGKERLRRGRKGREGRNEGKSFPWLGVKKPIRRGDG